MRDPNKISRTKLFKINRNTEIVNDFCAMDGSITKRVEGIAFKHNLAEVTVRLILVKSGIIGVNGLAKPTKV